MNLIFILLVPLLNKVEYKSVFFLLEKESFYNGIMGVAFFRFGFSTTNHAMCYPYAPIIIIFCKKLVEFFYHEITITSGSVIQVVVDNTRNPVVYEIAHYNLFFFHWNNLFFWITIFWPMGDTWQLIGGLVSIILTESSPKNNFSCSFIFLEWFNELLHVFDELFHARLSIFLDGFDELLQTLLLLSLKLDMIKLNFFDKFTKTKKQN